LNRCFPGLALFEKETIVGFWGVRGSTPTVDRANARYGGNTPCLEMITPDGTRFILDCGTGLRTLGNRWMATHSDKSFEAHIFVTHYHWDHIQGIPFFAPLYSPKHHFHFYSFPSPFLGKESLQQVFEAQMAKPYFPVDMSVMSAPRDFHEVNGGDRLDIKGVRITARWLNHPQGCLGFRMETKEGVFVYATDNEPGHPVFDKNVRKLAEGADVLIYDAQYLPEEYEAKKRGWGHSHWREAINIVMESGAKELVLFHHDPDHSDDCIDNIVRTASEHYPKVRAAQEGMEIQL
jgi:phosphoribosyl 1,2-cyclic phosphodiesterase